MVCHLFGTKPLSESMLDYHQLDHKIHIALKFDLKFKFFVQEYAFKYVVWKWQPYYLSISVLIGELGVSPILDKTDRVKTRLHVKKTQSSDYFQFI